LGRLDHSNRRKQARSDFTRVDVSGVGFGCDSVGATGSIYTVTETSKGALWTWGEAKEMEMDLGDIANSASHKLQG